MRYSSEARPVYSLWVQYPETGGLVEVVMDEELEELILEGEIGALAGEWVRWQVTDPFGLAVDGWEK